MKNKHKIFLALLLLVVVLGIAQAFKKSADNLVIEETTPVQQVDQTPIPPVYKEPVIVRPTQPNQPNNNGCYVGGCSGQICSDQPNMVSTCEFTPSYSCYQSANTTCERQANGQCGWTQTDELAQCLNDNPSSVQFQ